MTKAKNLNATEKVDEYMLQLEHPLKSEIEEVRSIIKSNSKISERVKWNAPSFFYKEDIVTFNHRAQNHVHLVFHHPEIVKIKSALLEGDYKDRRMTYFKNMQEVNTHKNELQNIISQLVNIIEDRSNAEN